MVNKIKRCASSSIIFLLSVYVLANPFLHTTTIKEGCFYGSVFFLIILFALGERDILSRKTPLRLPVLLFVSWVLIGMPTALDINNSWHDIYSHFFRYMIIYVLIVNFFDTQEKIEQLTVLIIFSIVVFVLWKLSSFYLVQGYSFSRRFFGNSAGMTYNLLSIPVMFAGYLAVSRGITTLQHGFLKICYFLAPIPLILAVIMTQARSAYIALVFSSMFFMFFFKKKFTVLLVISLAVIIFFAPGKNRFKHNVHDNIRINHALLTLEVTKDHFLTGIGFGMETFGKIVDLNAYKKRTEDTYAVKYKLNEVLLDPHNMYTDILVRTGIPGFVFFLFFVFSLFKVLWKLIQADTQTIRIFGLALTSSLCSFFLVGFFEPVFSHIHEFYFTVMVSLASILWLKENASDTNKLGLSGAASLNDVIN